MKTVRVEFRTKFGEDSWVYFTEFLEIALGRVTRYAVIEKLKNEYGVDTQLLSLGNNS